MHDHIALVEAGCSGAPLVLAFEVHSKRFGALAALEGPTARRGDLTGVLDRGGPGNQGDQP